MRSDDLPWLVERLRRESSAEVKQGLAELIGRIFDFRKSGHLDVIIESAETEPLIAEQFSWHLTPVELNSPEAKRQRESYQKYQEMERPPQKNTDEGPSPTEQIPILLDRFEAGDVDAWWQLNLAISVDPETGYLDDYEPDITQMPGWKTADDTIKSRIIQSALQYLLTGDPHTETWLGTNTIHRPAFAGYRALFLLFNLRNNAIMTLSTEVWQQWAPIILAYPIETGTGTDQPHLYLIELAYQNAEEQVLDTLDKLIDKDNKESGHLSVLTAVFR